MKFIKPLLIASIISLSSMAYAENNDDPPGLDYQVKFSDDIKHVLPVNSYDNDLVATCRVPQNQLFTEITGILRATKNGETVAYVTFAEPQGFKDKVILYSVIDTQGKILGVRVLKHNETIGRGAQITTTNWLDVFTNRHINEALKPNFSLKIDGGNIDKFSNSTITPRAIISELKADFIEFETKLVANPEIFNSWHTCTVNY